jgi:structural maintenance of chromosome 4
MPASAAVHDAHAGAGGKKARLMILKMVLENFKSWGGVKEIGPFHKSFSSIVGPNGSGKSNVIDAMLFVFGKRAAQMRLNKVSDLIHKSAEYPDLDFARVSVYFQEIVDADGDSADAADAYTVIPGSQFVVSRVAQKNNSSKYYVNGTGASMNDVTTLLKGKGIDLDNNRFLILQGEVEQISMMKPKSTGPNDDGLLEYLEEIIGSNKYIERISNAERVVETLSADRTEKLNRAKLVEKERNALEGAKLEAEGLMGELS